MRYSRQSVRAVAGLLVLKILAASAQAGGARILREAGGAEFSQISTAVLAALPGDVIVVGEGDYAGFTLEGKAVSIVGAPGASVRILNPVVLRDIPAGQVVLIDNLEFLPDFNTPIQTSDVPALWAIDCAAPLRIQDCRFDTTFQHPVCVGAVSIEPSRRDSPLRLERCPDAAVVGSELITGEAGYAGFDWGYCTGADGAPGARVSKSKVAFHGCAITGGTGGKAWVIPPSGDGGPGIDASSSFVLVTGSTVAGGLCYVGGQPASAVRLDAASTLVLVDSALLPGGSAPAIGGSGSVLDLPDAPRSLAAPSVSAAGSTIQVEVAGVAQDLVWTAVAQGGGFRFASTLGGAWLTKFPAKLTFAPNGAIGAAGVLAFPIPIAAHAGLARLVDLQSITSSALDGSVVTHARVVLSLSRTLGPDCNGNGTSDYVDVLLGGAPDADHDLVPDGCPLPAPKTVHVDVAAAPGGDGSPQAPFANLAQASGAAVDGDTILISDGVYAGPANREFEFHGRRLVISSINGASSCVLDLDGQGSAFRVAKAGVSLGGVARIAGLTIREPQLNYLSQLHQAGIVVDGLELEVDDCRFELGGKPIMTLTSSQRLTIRTTTFANCLYGLEIWVPTVIEDCLFENVGWIAVATYTSQHPIHVSRTIFRGNKAALLLRTTPSSPAIVENCLFQGNWAPKGIGGIEIDGGNTWIDACSFVANHSQIEPEGNSLAVGGAIYLHSPTTGPVLLSNSILRDNTCGSTIGWGEQIAIEGGITYKLTIVNSSVQGGKADIAGPGGASIWGAGNQTVDPLFVDKDGPDGDPQTLEDNDLHLSSTSPCIDAGNNSLALGLLDLEGLQRFVDDPAVPDTGTGTPPLCDMGCYEKP